MSSRTHRTLKSCGNSIIDFTAVLIEAYGASGAVALGDRYPLDFLIPLIEQTKQMRKSEEELEEEYLEEKQDSFIENNKNNHKAFTLPNGRKVSLSQFAVNSKDLIEGLK